LHWRFGVGMDAEPWSDAVSDDALIDGRTRCDVWLYCRRVRRYRGNRSHDQRPIRCQHCCCRLCCWLYLRCISPDHCAAQSPSPVARLCNAACPPTRRALHSLGERARRRTIPLLLFQWSLHAVGPAGRCSFFSSSQTHRSSLVPARRSPQLQPLRRFRWLSAFWRRSGDGCLQELGGPWGTLRLVSNGRASGTQPGRRRYRLRRGAVAPHGLCQTPILSGDGRGRDLATHMMSAVRAEEVGLARAGALLGLPMRTECIWAGHHM